MNETSATRIEAAPLAHPRAVPILVMGIVGITIFPFVGPVAWALGRTTLHEIDAAPGTYSNRATAQVGMVLGIVATVMLVVGLVLVVTIVVWATTGNGVKGSDLEAIMRFASVTNGR